MKKRIIIIIVSVIAILMFLFVPVPKGAYDDGGTREYVALTYKIVDWNRISSDGVYQKTRVYFGRERAMSVDELWSAEYENVEHKFIATVIELSGDSALVEPVEGEIERYSSDKIIINTSNLEKINVEAGSVVEIIYKGGIKESYPAQINATNWGISKNLKHLDYTDKWIDKTTSRKYDTNIFSDIIITEIYSNCFFARTVIPMPYTIKLNGSISGEWCIGDQVICTYENTYYDEASNRVEADMLGIEASDWQPDPQAAYKPVIYLYPEAKTDVSVKLNLNGEFICTYPQYNDGWTVTARPDGTLTDKNGKEYNYLFWEADLYTQYDLSKGYCVRGEDTAKFLEDMLAKLGLNDCEVNEFIVYWLPLMQNNPYNVISFQSDAYTDAARLDISPAPDTVIRIFMTWSPSNEYIDIAPQNLITPNRNGFTVVEWGGTKID